MVALQKRRFGQSKPTEAVDVIEIYYTSVNVGNEIQAKTRIFEKEKEVLHLRGGLGLPG